MKDYDIVNNRKQNNGCKIIKIRFCKYEKDYISQCGKCSRFNKCNENQSDNEKFCNDYGKILNHSKGEPVNFHLELFKKTIGKEINENVGDEHNRLPCRYFEVIDCDDCINDIEISFCGHKEKLLKLGCEPTIKSDGVCWDYELIMNSNNFHLSSSTIMKVCQEL